MNLQIKERGEIARHIVVEGARAILDNARKGNGWRENYVINGIELNKSCRWMFEATFSLPYGVCSVIKDNGKVNCYILTSSGAADREGVLNAAQRVVDEHESGRDVSRFLVRESYDYGELRKIERNLGRYHTMSEGFEEQPDSDPELIIPRKFLRRKKKRAGGS